MKKEEFVFLRTIDRGVNTLELKFDFENVAHLSDDNSINQFLEDQPEYIIFISGSDGYFAEIYCEFGQAILAVPKKLYDDTAFTDLIFTLKEGLKDNADNYGYKYSLFKKNC